MTACSFEFGKFYSNGTNSQEKASQRVETQDTIWIEISVKRCGLLPTMRKKPDSGDATQ